MEYCEVSAIEIVLGGPALAAESSESLSRQHGPEPALYTLLNLTPPAGAGRDGSQMRLFD